MKRLSYFLVVCCFAFFTTTLMSSFSWPWKGSNTTSKELTTPKNSDSFKVALIIPTQKNDCAWSQSMYDALQRTKNSDKTVIIEKIMVSEKALNAAVIEKRISQYIEEGYDLIVAHGSIYTDFIFAAAAKNPTSHFATFVSKGSRSIIPENVFAYDVAAEEAGYVNGVIAGVSFDFVSLGLVTPDERASPEVKAYNEGLRNGLLSIAPGSALATSYIQSLWYPEYATEAAGLLILKGAQVLTGIAPQAIGALYVAEANDIFWLGVESDQRLIAPNNVIVSQVYMWDSFLDDVLTKIKKGEGSEGEYRLDFKGGGIKTVFNDALMISDEARTITDKVIENIIEGYINPLENAKNL